MGRTRPSSPSLRSSTTEMRPKEAAPIENVPKPPRPFTSARSMQPLITPEGETLQRGTLILAPYQKGPKWPAVIRALPQGKKDKKLTFFYLPFYKGDFPFKGVLKDLDIFKAEMEPPEDADQALIAAYGLARDCLANKTPEEVWELHTNPPDRPAPPPKEQKKKELRRSQPAVKREYTDSEDEEHDEDHDARVAAECHRLISEDEGEESEGWEEEEEGAGQREPLPKRHRRVLDPNEVIFFDAQRVPFQSVDQVVLIRNPHGSGMWPAQPLLVCEEKNFANFVAFPRRKSKQKPKNRAVEPLPAIIRTTDTRTYEFNHRRLNSMLDFTKPRDPRLHKALLDVRDYLISRHRFDEAEQDRTPFEEITIEVHNLQSREDGATELSLDELTISTNIPDAQMMTTSNHESLIHKQPSARAKEAAKLEEKFATARQFADLKPTWLIRHRLYKVHDELLYEELTEHEVKEHFQNIWKGKTICNQHQRFVKCMCPQKTWFPSSYRVHASTGGIISDQTMEAVFQEYMKWMKLATSLPRMSYLEQFRYVMEIMFHEAAVFVLRQKYRWDRKRALAYIRDGQEYAFGLERGYRNQTIRNRLYPMGVEEQRPPAELKTEEASK